METGRNEEDRKSYRKIVLTRTMIRKFFNIPSHVDISGVVVEQDPMSLQILLTSDYDRMPWHEQFWDAEQKYSEEGLEDSESSILPYGYWQKWPNQ